MGGLRAPLRSLLVVLAVLSGMLWMQAHAVMGALHDDGVVVRFATAALDEPAVRTGIRTFATDAVVNTARARGVDLSDSPALLLLISALTSDKAIAKSTPAWIAATSQLRASVVARLESDDPALDTKPLTLNLAPVLKAVGLQLPTAVARGLGLPAGKNSLTVQVATGEQMRVLKQRYSYLVLIDRWAGWLALALAVGGVFASRHPLRAFTIIAAIGCAAALAVRPLIRLVAEWTTGLGDWGVLARPLTDAVGAYATSLAHFVAAWCAVAVGIGVAAMVVVAILRWLRRRPAHVRPEPPPPVPDVVQGPIER